MVLSVRVEATLLKSLITHLEGVSLRELPILSKTISRYCAKLLSVDQFNKVLGTLSTEARRQAKLWRRWSNNSWYFGSLWRALISHRPPVHWNVFQEDVSFVLGHLNEADLDQLAKLKRSLEVRRLSQHQMDTFVKILNTFSQRMAWRKLRFISKHDQGVSQEDLTAELLEVGLRTLRRYENESNELYVLNRAKRAIHNRAINLIAEHSTRKRARLVASSGNQEFRKLKVSYEDLEEVLGSQTNNVLDVVKSRLGPSYEHYTRAILGSWPDFDEWIKTWTRKDPKTMDPAKLSSFACEWVGLSKQEVEENLAPLLEEMES